MAQPACCGAHSRTVAALAYNGSSSHRTLPVGCNKKKLAETRVSKAWQPWVGHLTSHLKQAHLTLSKKRTLLKQKKVVAKPPMPI